MKNISVYSQYIGRLLCLFQMFARRCVCQLLWAATHRLTPAQALTLTNIALQHLKPGARQGLHSDINEGYFTNTTTPPHLTSPTAIIKHRQTLTVQRSDDHRHHHHHHHHQVRSFNSGPRTEIKLILRKSFP